MSPYCPHLSNKNSTNKSASMGVVKSGTIRQGTQEECLPFVYQVIGKQKTQEKKLRTSVLLVAYNWLHPSCHGPGAPGEHCLGQSPTDDRAFVEVQVSRGKVPALHWSKNHASSDTLEWAVNKYCRLRTRQAHEKKPRAE